MQSAAQQKQNKKQLKAVVEVATAAAVAFIANSAPNSSAAVGKGAVKGEGEGKLKGVVKGKKPRIRVNANPGRPQGQAPSADVYHSDYSNFTIRKVWHGEWQEPTREVIVGRARAHTAGEGVVSGAHRAVRWLRWVCPY